MAMSDPGPAYPWSVRPYQPGDEQALVELFGRVFGRAITEDNYRWKLVHAADARNVWLATEAGATIFHYAGIPTRFRLPAGEVTAMVSVDTMTAPEHQRRGLLGAVGRIVYDRWRDAGVPFVIGLPNERWGSRAAALGWVPLFPLRWLTMPIRPERLVARRIGIGDGWARGPAPLAAGWRVARRLDRWRRRDPELRLRAIEHAGPEIDRLWRRIGARSPISVVRDSAWVAWRYLDARATGGRYRVLLAERSGEPAGYVACRLAAPTPAAGGPSAGAPAGIIAEIFADESDSRAAAALIAAAADELDAAGAAAVATLAVPDSWLERRLRLAGFLRRPARFGVQLVPLTGACPPPAVLADPHSWSIFGGDFDVV